MAYIGPSFARATKGNVFTFKFTMTVADVPTDLTTPTVKAYEEGSAVEFTGGITLTAPYDAKVGLNELVIDTSNAAYTAGKNYDFFFSAGSIGAVTLVGTGFFHLALIPEPADLRMVNGGSTGSTAGKLELTGLYVTAAAGTAVQITSDDSTGIAIQGSASSNNNPGVNISSNGGPGVSIGGHLNGVEIFSDTTGDGIYVEAQGSGHALSLTPDGAGKAINALGQVYVKSNSSSFGAALELDATDADGPGLYVHGGYGIQVTGDGDSGADAISITANRYGVFIEGDGSGFGYPSVNINAPNDGGSGISIQGLAGNSDAIVLTPNGTGNGINITATAGAAIKAYSETSDATIDIGKGISITGSAVKIECDGADPAVSIAQSGSGRAIDVRAGLDTIYLSPGTGGTGLWIDGTNADSTYGIYVDTHADAMDLIARDDGARGLAIASNGAGSPALYVLNASSGNSVSVGDEAASIIAEAAGATADALQLIADGTGLSINAAVEGSIGIIQSLMLANAANAGKANGMGTTTVHLRDLADTKNRITATVDANGNRSAVTRNVT